jgi:NAD(P)-dependent dehydrogenase (short-subunit alcohol dehydrogenase family)
MGGTTPRTFGHADCHCTIGWADPDREIGLPYQRQPGRRSAAAGGGTQRPHDQSLPMRTVIVTGAGSGIGASTAARFVSLGDHVYAADITTNETPPGSTPVECDVTDPVSVESAIRLAVAETGRLDVLINNAGVRTIGNVVTTTLGEWERVFAVNSTGVFLGCKFALPHMIERHQGAIVNVASMAAITPMRDRAAYCASKGAVIALTKQIALQYAGDGIRANAVCPGPTLTPFVRGALERAPDPAAAQAAYASRQPLGRLGNPDEIAMAIVYLASAEASFVTGVALEVDGGVSLVNSM